MPPLNSASQKLGLALLTILMAVVLALSLLTPGFFIDNGLVYGGF
jgi:hypothetical protein